MILASPITIPAIAELRAKAPFFPDGGDVHFFLAFYASGNELNVSRLEVVARDASPSRCAAVNASRTSTGDAFILSDMPSTVPMAAGQLKLAIRSGQDDDSSLDALLTKAIDLGLVILA